VQKVGLGAKLLAIKTYVELPTQVTSFQRLVQTNPTKELF